MEEEVEWKRVSRFMRGQDSRSDNQSNLELDVLVMFQGDYLRGEILEMPLTPPWTDIVFTLERKNPVVVHPDYRFMRWRFWRPIFVDGPVHLGKTVSRRDAEVNRLLEEHGYNPLRYEYSENSAKTRRQIHDAILEDLAK